MFADEGCDGWKCPGFGVLEEPTAELPPDRKAILSDVALMTGATDLRTCPVWYASLPWVHRAVMAHAWREHGQLEVIEPDPSYALVQAIDLVARGNGRKLAADMERARKKGGDDGNR